MIARPVFVPVLVTLIVPVPVNGPVKFVTWLFVIGFWFSVVAPDHAIGDAIAEFVPWLPPTEIVAPLFTAIAFVRLSVPEFRATNRLPPLFTVIVPVPPTVNGVELPALSF